jgi:signal transduction histidine kinase
MTQAMGSIWFFAGIAVGLLLAIPAIALAQRWERRRLQRLEARARAAERLAALGKLTGGLAHEIKNPLSSVGLNVQLLQEDLNELSAELPRAAPEEPEASSGRGVPDAVTVQTIHELIGRIQRRFGGLARETQRLRDILEDFLRYAGRVKLDRQPVEINALVDELVDFFAPQAQATQVRLRTQLASAPITVGADSGLLKQALLNLLINATQAMIEARESGRAHGGANELILRTEVARDLGQPEVRIHVIDTGPGIAPEDRDRVFEPYFSTKKTGTGLGLPTARRIVEEHGGTLSLHSEPGRGSDFVVILPVEAPSVI